MNIKQYLSYQYLFQTNTVFVSPQEKLFFLSGGILVLLAIVLKIAAVLSPNPVDQKFRNKFYRLFLTIGLAQIFWYLCRYENVLFFGTHFVALVIALIGVIWLVAILVSIFRFYRPAKEVWEKEQVKLKYLPK
jgi:Ca2+/Na+ antiporter